MVWIPESETLIRTQTIQKEVTPQLYHSDEDDIQSQYSNELSQLRNIDTTLMTLVIKPEYQTDPLRSIADCARSVIGLPDLGCSKKLFYQLHQ